MEAERFAMVPTAAFADRRLTLQQLRVLGALCSFLRNSTDKTVFPKRSDIAERTGMALCKVSEATTALEAMGWVRKVGKGGFSKACQYQITVPETVTDQVTVTESVTVTDQVRGVVTDSVRGMRVTDSVRGNKEKINKREIGEPAGFSECWSAYPKRSGPNNRAQALRAYQARIKAGVSHADILAGVKRYALYCQSERITATKYVKQTATFLGPDNHFADEWSSAPASASNDSSPPDFMAAALRTNKEAAHVD